MFGEGKQSGAIGGTGGFFEVVIRREIAVVFGKMLKEGVNYVVGVAADAGLQDAQTDNTKRGERATSGDSTRGGEDSGGAKRKPDGWRDFCDYGHVAVGVVLSVGGQQPKLRDVV
ncbi:MAG: hypothetical protein LBT53_07960 [Puniceicoccales bacterium]|nr:hypothetical protein [Puniceicoccales bacterium]